MLTESSSLYYLVSRGNEAVNINAPTGANFHITDHGSDWLWTVFSIFALATLVFVGYSFTKPNNERVFFQLYAASMFVLSVSYFTQASNLGWAPVHAEFNHITVDDQTEFPGFRQIFYARWVAYFLAFPGPFVSYAALVGLSWSNALFTLFGQELTVVGLLVGTLIHSTYKWGYYTFGVAGFFLVAFSLFFTYRKAALETDSALLSKHSLVIASASTLILMLYPIAWALSEGGNVIQPDSEAVFYGILDICFFLIIGGYFHWVASKVDFQQRGISAFQSKVFASDLSQGQQQQYYNEKVAVPAPATEGADVNARASEETAAANKV